MKYLPDCGDLVKYSIFNVKHHTHLTKNDLSRMYESMHNGIIDPHIIQKDYEFKNTGHLILSRKFSIIGLRAYASNDVEDIRSQIHKKVYDEIIEYAKCIDSSIYGYVMFNTIHELYKYFSNIKRTRFNKIFVDIVYDELYKGQIHQSTFHASIDQFPKISCTKKKNNKNDLYKFIKNIPKLIYCAIQEKYKLLKFIHEKNIYKIFSNIPVFNEYRYYQYEDEIEKYHEFMHQYENSKFDKTRSVGKKRKKKNSKSNILRSKYIIHIDDYVDLNFDE